MKKLILSISSLLLLAIQVNAKQSNEVTINSTTVNKTSNSHAYTVNTQKNSTQVNYSSTNNAEVVDDSPMRAKSFNKSFALDRGDKVNINNQYGSITVKIWNKNEIKVEGEIKAYARTDAEAQKLLDEVSIIASKDGDLVSYKTQMGERKGNWGSNVKNGKTIWRKEVKTHVTVYMPAANSLTLSQQYGNILMDDFNGPTSIKLQYGNLIAGNLSNANNYISIQYGKGEVKDMGGATINHQYGDGFKGGNIGNLNINAQYTAVNLVSVKGTASIKHQYGSGTTIGSVSGAANVNVQYCDLNIGNLRGNLTSKAQYGKVKVGDIEAGRDVDVDAQYSSVNLGFASNYNGDFEVRTSYASFDYPSTFTVRKVGDDKSYSSRKNYSGQIGKGGNGKIIVNVQYDGVMFK